MLKLLSYSKVLISKQLIDHSTVLQCFFILSALQSFTNTLDNSLLSPLQTQAKSGPAEPIKPKLTLSASPGKANLYFSVNESCEILRTSQASVRAHCSN